jgi:RNA polymerase sigma factor (sigma-70 family)
MTTMSEHRSAASRHLSTVFGAGALGLLPDGELLRRFLAGRGDEDSAAAFAAVVERHGPMVLGVCRRALGNLHDAEDAAQATFLVLARRGGSIRRAESLASWLFGVALKIASKRRTQAVRRQATEQRGAEMKAQPAGAELSPEACSELYEELDRLPERFRAPIVLCHLEGLTNEQAAVRLDVPVRTVQRRLSEGRERLRYRLARLGLAPAFGPVIEVASESWIEATVRAATGLAAGRAVGAVASAPVAALVNGTMAAMLAARARAITAAVLLAASLAALGGVGAWLVAGQRAQPPAAKAEGTRSAPPSFDGDGRWIKGIVVDESGKPVAGARVAPLWFRPQSVISGADGTFVVAHEDPRRSNQAVIATADGGARQGIFRYFGPAGVKGPRTLARVVLRPAQVVTVTVVDKGGAPVQDAAVFVLDVVLPVAEARTDARGIARLRVSTDAWIQWIVGAKPGVGFDYFENYRGVPAFPWNPPPRSARLVLDGVRTVRVRAVDSAGRPVPGVEMYPVQIQKKGKLRSVNLSPLSIDPRTDAKGVATFDWLPADLLYGTSFFTASLSHGLLEWPTLVVNKPETELTARVVRATRVSGKVTRPDGSAAAGIRVEANGVGGSQIPVASGRAWTAADGSYEMFLAPEQSYTIAVVDAEWAAQSKSGVVIREDVPQSGLDLTLERGSVIHGRVTAGPGSRPSPGHTVTLTEERGPAVPPGTFKHQPPNPVFNHFERICDTDEDGRYAFRVAPGGYRLTKPWLRGDQPARDDLTVLAGRDLERDFHLARDDRPWKTLRVVVRTKDAGGPPIAGAIMVLQPIEFREVPAQGSADDQGRFELPRLPGKLIIYARSPAGDYAGYAVIGGDHDGEVTLVAQPAATARGRVVDEDGKPWVGIDVYCVVEVGLPAVGRDGPPGAGQSVTTDGDGRFTALGLPVGATCRVRAYAPDLGDSPSHRIEVKDTRPLNLPPMVINRPRPADPKPGPR